MELSGDEVVFGHGRSAGIEAPEGYEAVYHCGYSAHIGPVFGQFPKNEEVVGRFLFDAQDHHLNAAGQVQGGVLMSLADVALGASATHLLDGAPTATVSLNCDFTGSAQSGERLLTEARVTRKTKSILFLSGSVTVVRGDETFVLLTATGVWKILKDK